MLKNQFINSYYSNVTNNIIKNYITLLIYEKNPYIFMDLIVFLKVYNINSLIILHLKQFIILRLNINKCI